MVLRNFINSLDGEISVLCYIYIGNKLDALKCLGNWIEIKNDINSMERWEDIKRMKFSKSKNR